MKRFKLSLLLLLLLASLSCFGCGYSSFLEDSGPGESEISEEENAQSEAVEKPGQVADPAASVESGGESAADGGNIFIQVAGAVKKPGVYELPSGSRVFEAIDRAGGLAGDADESDLNQAVALEDGQKIYIFRQGEERPEESESSDSSSAAQADTSSSPDPGGDKININTADAGVLTRLSGIGETKAAAIISYRESNGGFASVEDIMNVEGIAEGTFNKIKDYITI